MCSQLGSTDLQCSKFNRGERWNADIVKHSNMRSYNIRLLPMFYSSAAGDLTHSGSELIPLLQLLIDYWIVLLLPLVLNCCQLCVCDNVQVMLSSGVLVTLTLNGPQLEQVCVDHTLVSRLPAKTVTDGSLQAHTHTHTQNYVWVAVYSTESCSIEPPYSSCHLEICAYDYGHLGAADAN